MIVETGKKVILTVVYLACALVMYSTMKNTKPTKIKHAQAISSVVENVMDDIFQNRIEFPTESRELADKLSRDVIPKAVDKLTRGKLNLTDLHLFNIGEIVDENGENKIVSIGIFGQVFVLNDDEVAKVTEQELKNLDIMDENKEE